jgi:hypothetical protein
MIRELTNKTAIAIVLTDFQGISVAPDETINGLQFGEDTLKSSTSVLTNLLEGKLTLSDGKNTYQGTTAVDLLRGTANQVTADGKAIFTVSDRPKDTYRYFSSRGDNLVAGTVGDGVDLMFTVAPGATVAKDFQCIEGVYIKDGRAVYNHGNSNLSHLSMTLICPAGMPFPAPEANGNYDLVGGNWINIPDNTGNYFILPTETPLHRFINKLPMPSYTNLATVDSAEPQFLPTPYILRFEVYNGSDATTDLHCCVSIGMYRKRTI